MSVVIQRGAEDPPNRDMVDTHDLLSGDAPRVADLPAAARRHLAVESELIYAPYQTATWRITRPSGATWYLKAAPVGLYPSLAAERDRCLWLAAKGVPVPEVVDAGADDAIEWLLTAALVGDPATAPQHLNRPRTTVRLLAEGLRAFHEVDPAGCPFDYRIPTALAHAAERVETGVVDPGGFHEVHRHLTPEQALARLRQLRPTETDVVVCHGDYCFPNVFLDSGRIVGYLDLGEVGVADRWRDLAVATWSVTWNVGPGYEDLFLDAYGADWDLPRRDFYRLLYDLES